MAAIDVTLPRRLAAAAPGWTTEADVVVIGSGIAGLTAALRLAPPASTEVLVVTKDVLVGRAPPSGRRAGSPPRSAPATPPSSTSTTPSSPVPALCDVEAVRDPGHRGPRRGARARSRSARSSTIDAGGRARR